MIVSSWNMVKNMINGIVTGREKTLEFPDMEVRKFHQELQIEF